MEIKLEKRIAIQKKITSDVVKVHQVIDDQTAQRVSAILIMGEIDGNPVFKTVTIWDVEEYGKAGQWTDEDLREQIIKILYPETEE